VNGDLCRLSIAQPAKRLFGPLTKSLTARLWGVDLGQPNSMLPSSRIKNRQRVAISYADNSADDL
jgi:hypothetical protein